MNTKWFADQSAKIAYIHMKEALDPLVVKMFPEYELSHFGINQNHATEEVIIKLHLNKLGRVRVVSEGPWEEDYNDHQDQSMLKAPDQFKRLR